MLWVAQWCCLFRSIMSMRIRRIMHQGIWSYVTIPPITDCFMRELGPIGQLVLFMLENVSTVSVGICRTISIHFPVVVRPITRLASHVTSGFARPATTSRREGWGNDTTRTLHEWVQVP